MSMQPGLVDSGRSREGHSKGTWDAVPAQLMVHCKAWQGIELLCLSNGYKLCTEQS